MSKLLDRTIELLDSTLIPMTKIAKAVGCTTATLGTIRARKNTPSVVLCEKIYNLLSKTELEVK